MPARGPGEREVDPRGWINAWIDPLKGKPLVGPLHLGRFLDPMYFLMRPIGWIPGPEAPTGLPKVDVPTGFVTDLASIPQFFWCILRPDGSYAAPAIVHDYLYWTQPVSREVADDVFRAAMYHLPHGEVPDQTGHGRLVWHGHRSAGPTIGCQAGIYVAKEQPSQAAY